MIENLFPNLKKGRWKKINLDDFSRLNNSLRYEDAEVCQRWIEKIPQIVKADYIYGGFGENRSHLWKNTYLQENQTFIHLGVDFAVRAGTEVGLIKPGKIVDVWADKDQNGGWGGRILWEILDRDIFVLYGHLEHAVQAEIGKEYDSGHIVGKVGKPCENGNWFEHLHVQVMTGDYLRGRDPKKIDGYSHTKGLIRKEKVLDPLKFIRMPRLTK